MDDRQKLIVDNMPLAYFFAKRYTYTKLDFRDLLQEACVGLCRAADSFDPAKGKFGTYAAYWIRSQIRNYAAKQWRYNNRAVSTDVHSEGITKQFAEETEETVSQAQQDKLNQMLEGLNEREKVILYRRVVGNDTLDSIGQTYGISRERVRQIEKRALQKIEEEFKDGNK